MSSGIYTYKRHCEAGLDIHEIFVKKSRLRVLLSYISVFFPSRKFVSIIAAGGAMYWIGLEYYLWHSCRQVSPIQTCEKRVCSDNTSFWGSARDTFLEILKPSLNECVTPVTCYWRLALLCDEDELLLVFQKFRPPVKMLVPVWKALGTFTNSECTSGSGVHTQNSSET